MCRYILPLSSLLLTWAITGVTSPHVPSSLVSRRQIPSSSTRGKTCGILATLITYECHCPMIRVVFTSFGEGGHSRHGFLLQYKVYGGQARESVKVFDAIRPRVPGRCSNAIKTTNNGVISSPGYPGLYPNDLRCEWRIIAPLQSIIRLDIDSLSTEEEESSCRDGLLVYDGVGEDKVLRGLFCGNLSNHAIKSREAEMTLVFMTSSRVALNGFSLRYSFWKLQPDSMKTEDQPFPVGCPTANVFTAESADLKSPNYPNPYPGDLDCWWTVHLDSGNRLQVVVVDLALEDSPNCTWDHLDLYDGEGDKTQLLVTLCGNKSNLVLRTNSDSLTLHLRTDSSVSSRGFYICYREVTASPAETAGSDRCGSALVDPSPMAGVLVDERGAPRVVGGRAAVAKSWPWIVRLQDRMGKFFCGATIIHKKWILTAAHCNFMVGSDRVFVGQTNASLPATEAIVRQSHVHEQYEEGHDYDICLLELETPLVLGDSIAVICLPQETDVLEGDTYLTAGWGATKARSGQYTKILQQAQIPLVPTEVCKKYWGADISERNLCAGGIGATSCLGDSGGPLICRDGNKYVLVGIVSWGSDTCDPEIPAVYTSVFPFRSWIRLHTGF